MTKAICTPTATREEFESILMELDGVGVKWESGDSPSDTWCLDYYFSGCVISYKWDGEKNLMCGYFKSSREKQLPRAEFISAIKRDFAPKIDCSYPTEIKEKPKMNYNKMTKAELIEELKKRGADISNLEWYVKDLESKLDAVIANRDDWMKDYGKLKKINSELLEDTKRFEKTNAEQAEKIESLASDIKMARIYEKENRDKFREVHTALIKTQSKLKEQTASISKFVVDVLEGK